MRFSVSSIKIWYLLILFSFNSCTDLDVVNARLDSIEGDVTDLKTALYILEGAYKEGKIITSVKPLESEQDNDSGWIIIFSDDSRIVISVPLKLGRVKY